jgi:vacuolar-type H+-ATPase subunit C/Vma6
MSNYKNVITDTLYGANVTTLSKTTADEVDQQANSKLKEHISEGVGAG